MKLDYETFDKLQSALAEIDEVVSVVKDGLNRQAINRGVALDWGAGKSDAVLGVNEYFTTCRTAYYLCDEAQTLIAKLMAETEKGR